MGWGRGQWYTARWLDRLLFPQSGPSADRLHPEWQDLKIGDRVLDGAPDKHTAFVVAELEPNRHLVLHSRAHLPPEWADRYGAAIDWSWQFVLDPLTERRTRFIFRSRLRRTPKWVEAFYLAVIVPADFIMARQMMRGIKKRGEAMKLTDWPTSQHDSTAIPDTKVDGDNRRHAYPLRSGAQHRWSGRSRDHQAVRTLLPR